jgi:hypothetical protein
MAFLLPGIPTELQWISLRRVRDFVSGLFNIDYL